MRNNSEINAKIEDLLNDRISSRASVGGGCISNAERMEMQSGRTYFLKSGSRNLMFINEANGLKELAKPDVIRVPEVILVDEQFILLEFVKQGFRRADFYEIFGRQFAMLHNYHSERIGFYEDNYIGASPQINSATNEEAYNWTLFYMNKRLLFQLHLAEEKGYATEKLRKGFHLLENEIEIILSGSKEEPSLLHGDLWGGNYLCHENGSPVLIDPAVYYGHREADLAMTKLFGGFSYEFYSAYREELPLKEGAEYREDIYTLYHVMNHLNLFGMSYYSQAERLLWKYL
jgi:protein-ribulosamine 3-kinase